MQVSNALDEEIVGIPGKSTFIIRKSFALAASAKGNVKVNPDATLNEVSERVGVTVVADVAGVADFIRNSCSRIYQFFFVKSPEDAGEIE